MKARCPFLFVMGFVLLLGGCGGNDRPDESPIINEEPLLSQSPFTDEQEAFLSDLRSRGGLRVGVLPKPGLLDIDDQGEPGGFKADLLNRFGAYLGIDIEIVPIEFSQLFLNQGTFDPDVLSDPYLSYSPDIFEEVDLLGDLLTILPWRLKLMDMAGFLPGREMIIHRNDVDVRHPDDLRGLRIVSIPGSSFERTLVNYAEQKNLAYEPVEMDFDQDIFAALENGLADAALLDSHMVFLRLPDYPGLNAAFPIADLNYLAWGMPKGSDLLMDLVQNFFAYAREEGVMDSLFQRHFATDLEGYYRMIGHENFHELYRLNLTASERDWIEERRQEGVLRIATILSRDNYLPLDDGTILGFDYQLAQSFAATLGLSLEVTAFESITPFFEKDGIFDPAVITNPDISYTPDLIDLVDLYCLPLSITPWRQKLMQFVELYPVGQGFAGRVGESFSNLTALDGKRLAVLPDSHQENLLTQLAYEQGFTVEFVYLESTQDPLALISSGDADYVLEGLVNLLKGSKDYDNIEIFPSPTMSLVSGWSVAKDDVALASILRKFVNLSLADGSFGAQWTSHNGLDFEVYMDFVRK